VLVAPWAHVHAQKRPSRGVTLLRGAHWVSAWGASPEAPRGGGGQTGFDDQSLREIVFASVGGSQVRVRITNRFGARPLLVGRAAVGIAGPHERVTRNHELRFSGRPSVVVPVGRELLSDPIPLRVNPLQKLAVSMFFPRATGPVTVHDAANEVGYLSGGDHVLASRVAPLSTRVRSWFVLDEVDVLASARVLGTVVALGDSITDGAHSTVGADARWPDDLSRELSSDGDRSLGVVDEGIDGNRLLSDSPCFGPAALTRFRADVLRQADVREVILLEGINDIGMTASTGACGAPSVSASAGQVIDAYRRIIREAHAAGLKIFGATLLPFRDTGYWSPRGEVKREAINRWIRHSGAFDGVIDFAHAVAQPGAPQQLAPRYDSGDHLHPNDAGYRAMAAAINLAMLLRGA
jgi:lysophospholipase L1-like esterase